MLTLWKAAKADTLGFPLAWSPRNETNRRDPVPISYDPCDFGTMLIFPLSNNLIGKRRGPVRRQQFKGEEVRFEKEGRLG